MATCVLAAPLVSAATPEEEKAFSLYQAAADDFQARDFEAALDKLEEAYLLFPKPLILMKKAEALEHLGRIEEAHEAFSQITVDGGKIEVKVEAALQRLEVALANPVSVSVLSGELVGASIFIDGVDSGKKTPTLLQLSRGEHSVRLVKPGYEPWEKAQLQVRGANTLLVDGRLKQLVGQVSVRLSAGTFDDATVALDGRSVTPTTQGASATALMELPAGEHEVVCTRPDVPPFRRRFEVAPGAAATVVCVLDEPAGVDVAPWALVGSGGALFAGGVTFLAWHLAEVDYAKRTRQRLVPAIPHRDIIGGVMMGVGVGVALTSLIFFLSDDDDEADSAAQVLRPDAWTAGGAGFAGVGGSF